jgi:YfiH family protein
MTNSEARMTNQRVDWPLVSADGIKYFRYSPDPRLLLAFFTRVGGSSCGAFESLNTSFQVGDKDECVEENLERARRALGLSAILTFRQTHSDQTQSVDEAGFPSSVLERDAFFTSRADLGLGLRIADCLPVYLYAADLSCAGIAHCGWRGTVARLAGKTARQMSRNYSVPLSDMRFALGPCICPKCYAVGEDVRAEFRKNFENADQFFTPVEVTQARDDQSRSLHPFLRYHLDLAAANRLLLTELGLVECPSLSLCTFEDAGLFYSARRDTTTGRNLAVIALR